MNQSDKLCCPISLCPQDDPTKLNHLGWKFALTLCTWVILGYGVNPGNGFFVSLELFSIPLLADYLKFKPYESKRKKCRNIGIVISGAWGIIGFFGLAGILVIKNVNNTLMCAVSSQYLVLKNSMFPVVNLWYWSALLIGCVIIEWVIYSSPLENKVMEEVDKAEA